MGDPACELCGRAGAPLTRHHLVPRARIHGRRGASRLEKQGDLMRVAALCKACHRFVHVVLTEREMEQQFNTVGRLKAHPEIARFVEWIRTKPAGFQPGTPRRRQEAQERDGKARSRSR